MSNPLRRLPTWFLLGVAVGLGSIFTIKWGLDGFFLFLASTAAGALWGEIKIQRGRG